MHSAETPDAPFPDSLSGLIERVTFFNEETGFAVLKVKVKAHRELVTVIGTVPAVNAGEWITAQGRWVHDKEHGLQLKAELLKCSAPTTLEGIEKYLGSGMVKGIGPVYASKLVAQFGTAIFDIIENFSARLEEVDGIGPGRRRKIKDAWAEQKTIRKIMVFLHSHGVSSSRAVRIYKTYGETAIDQVQSNPYRLALDIQGIGFKTADQIAQHLGIPSDSLLRATAGLRHVLLEASGQGHCALPVEALLDAAGQLLLVPLGLVQTALERSLSLRELVAEDIGGERWIFTPQLSRAEQTIAERLKHLAAAPPNYPAIDLDKAIAWCQEKTGTELAPSQRAALGMALTSRFLIVTGGPGVGKTTLVNAILKILRAKKVRCLLCAPTGRAAKRLSESTGLPAQTIHRLLEAKGQGGFERNDRNPLECDLLVVDEGSMIDVPLMSYLLRALPEAAALILVGDVDQLPSVGPGLVLRDLIDSGVARVTRLTEVFRQAAHSRIITAAHQINQGFMPDLPPGESDFYFIERQDPESIAKTLAEVLRDRIPARFKLDPIRDVQVLSPMNRGSLGVHELNLQLQNLLNPLPPGGQEIEKFGWKFRAGDKVIQTENNYDKEVFNGDIGQIVRLAPEERELTVRYEQREVIYEYGELDELSLAYTITIHKSQGSEFPVVVMPLATQHYLLLQRNLVYTGITRGKKLVVLIGQPKALGMAIRNNKTEQRYSGLLYRLKQPPSSSLAEYPGLD